jgi:hypothetical protein
MFDVAAAGVPSRRRKEMPNRALWTENKALLIERYLYYFVLVTKSGTYIDGFAGPQSPGVHGQRSRARANASCVASSAPPRSRHSRYTVTKTVRASSW